MEKKRAPFADQRAKASSNYVLSSNQFSPSGVTYELYLVSQPRIKDAETKKARSRIEELESQILRSQKALDSEKSSREIEQRVHIELRDQVYKLNQENSDIQAYNTSLKTQLDSQTAKIKLLKWKQSPNDDESFKELISGFFKSTPYEQEQVLATLHCMYKTTTRVAEKHQSEAAELRAKYHQAMNRLRNQQQIRRTPSRKPVAATKSSDSSPSFDSSPDDRKRVVVRLNQPSSNENIIDDGRRRKLARLW